MAKAKAKKTEAKSKAKFKAPKFVGTKGLKPQPNGVPLDPVIITLTHKATGLSVECFGQMDLGNEGFSTPDEIQHWLSELQTALEELEEEVEGQELA